MGRGHGLKSGDGHLSFQQCSSPFRIFWVGVVASGGICAYPQAGGRGAAPLPFSGPVTVLSLETGTSLVRVVQFRPGDSGTQLPRAGASHHVDVTCFLWCLSYVDIRSSTDTGLCGLCRDGMRF